MFQYQSCMKGYDKWTWGCKSIVGTLTPWQGGWGATRWVRQHVRQQGCRYGRRAHGERPSKRRQVPLRSLSVQVAKTIGSLHSLQQQTTINAQCSLFASPHTPYPPSHFEQYLLWSWYLGHLGALPETNFSTQCSQDFKLLKESGDGPLQGITNIAGLAVCTIDVAVESPACECGRYQVQNEIDDHQWGGQPSPKSERHCW